MMPLFDNSGVHLGFVKILRDRTDEHLAGVALQRATARDETILGTVDSAFAIVEVRFDADDRPVDYRFLEANPTFARQSGADLQGKWVTEYAPDLEPFWFETYGRVAMTREPVSFESYAEAFGRWFDVRTVLIGDPSDRQIAILFNDVTERREAEERLRASEAVARENIERVQLASAAGAIIGTWHWGHSQRPAVDCVAKGGTISIMEVYPPTDNHFPIGAAMNKNVTLRMRNCNHRRYYDVLIEHVLAGRLDPARS